MPKIVEALLKETSTEDKLFFGERDDMWTEGLAIIERMPDLVPVKPAVAVLPSEFQEGEEDLQQQLIDLLGKSAGYVVEQPFLDLLQDEYPMVAAPGWRRATRFR